MRQGDALRFRPLLMTALTSFIGHPPMLYATGSGPDLYLWRADGHPESSADGEEPRPPAERPPRTTDRTVAGASK